MNPRTLNAHTKLRIRASSTLWDILIGQRDDLGHPDEAILQCDDEAPSPKDLDNYKTHIEKKEVKIALLGWAKGTKETIFETQYRQSLWDSGGENFKKIANLPYPDWLQPPIQSVSLLKEEALSEKKQKTKKVKQPNFHEKFSVKIEKLSPSKEEVEPEETFVLLSNNMPTTDDSVIPQKDQDKEKTDSFLIVSSDKMPIVESSAILQEDDGTIVSSSNYHDERLPAFRETKTIENNSPHMEKPRPRGMRLFHSHTNNLGQQLPEPAKELKGKHKKIQNYIFDHQCATKVTFGKFKLLWKHICGEKSVIETTGSSHKKLIGPNQRAFGVFAHSDGMQYSLRTIIYLRDALTQIGYGL